MAILMKKKIEKLVRKGDLIYSAANGMPMIILEIEEDGIETEEDFFPFMEVGNTFFLHPKSFEKRRSGEWK